MNFEAGGDDMTADATLCMQLEADRDFMDEAPSSRQVRRAVPVPSPRP